MNELSPNPGEISGPNPERLPVMKRDTASTVVFSSDGRVLLGRKDAKGGGVYVDSWHLPGGGAEEGEALPAAALRELSEEVVGLNAQADHLEPLPWLQGQGATTKTVDGTKFWCEMSFNYFRVVCDRTAEEVIPTLQPGSDFVELRFFSPQELSELPTMPGGIEEKIISGTLTATSTNPPQA